MKKSFTIIELITVIAIILLIATLSSVAIAAVLKSSNQQGVLQTLDGAMISARSLAKMYGCTVALRIEHSFKVDNDGKMVKVNDNPVWEDHQQIRFLIQGYRRNNISGDLGNNHGPFNGLVPEDHGFRNILNMPIIELPSSHWLAPGEAMVNLQKWNKEWKPLNNNAIPLNLFENFYIIVRANGSLTTQAKWLYYLDETQNGTPAIDYPYNGVRSVVIYDRRMFMSGRTKESLDQGIYKPFEVQ